MNQFIPCGSFVASIFVTSLLFVAVGGIGIAFAQEKAVSNTEAKQFSEEVIAMDEDEVKILKAYSVKLVGVLPGRKATRYLQIENNIRATLRYELAAMIPLVW
jgi:hypothetical protein